MLSKSGQSCHNGKNLDVSCAKIYLNMMNSICRFNVIFIHSICDAFCLMLFRKLQLETKIIAINRNKYYTQIAPF